MLKSFIFALAAILFIFVGVDGTPLTISSVIAANSKIRPSHTPITDADAVHAIIGEAANQGCEGMLAVASAIRNRGTLKGVYGVFATHIRRESFNTFQRANWAWRTSKFIDITYGATHWEATRRFGTPYWAKDMVITIVITDHTFYRSKHVTYPHITASDISYPSFC